MPLGQLVLDVVGLVLLVVLLYGIALIVRRRLLARHGGTFELSFRSRTTHPGRGWLLGIGRYSGDSLEWFRIFSLSARPKRSWHRDHLAYAGRRAPEGVEEVSLYEGHVVVSCTYRDVAVELAMSEASLTGLQAWLEAGPPGADWNRR
ncbi:MAG: DUF2550 domain-containing protein [Nocardioides sp.]|nr:DUF2550 domain-containing protein [Nocardioides sp.]